MQETAAKALKYFETATRDNGDTFIRNTDDAPEWVKELVRDAHDGMMPDDYKYRFVELALEHIADGQDAHEWEGDIYNADLLKWVSSDLNRAQYVDEVLEEYGVKELYKALAFGQTAEYREVYASVESSLYNFGDYSGDE